MAIDATPPFGLTVLPGGRDWRSEEAHIERIVGLDDAIEGATLAYALVAGLAADADSTIPTDLRWSQALHCLGRIHSRASAARDEVLALTAPDGDAA